ncbi:MAG: TonB-dependent receptor [Candidatus Nitricoxidivorans perseverans]|uniref:TonB-dependent receptor n=1 Tax=Candidatus Nitricoxidivorans perseverans TaxID=2975601 RepID=A0AA49IXT9_9PROT|nr:MAG: TonB-dependent receptor [Candidatus Nitricoxidivorans perseverans]
MTKRTLIVPILGLCHVLSVQAHADEKLEQLLSLSLEELMAIKVTISTNTRQSLSRAPSVISVITAEDVRATGADNLMDILQAVPGIYVKTNLFGFKPLITFRGASGANVLLMVNGAPAKDLVWSPGIFWKGMPANMIERIEIIRGPGSALFGSDASAGVINVITKTAGKIEQSEAGVRAGSFGSRAAWVRHGTQWNGLDIAFTADVSHTDGHDPYIARARSDTAGNAEYAWDNTDLHLSVGKGNWRMLADHTRHGNVQIGLTGAAVLDPRTRANDRQANLALFYDNPEFAPDWGLNAELRYRDIEYSSGNGFWEGIAGTVNLNQMDSSERRLNFEASTTYSGFRNHALRMGGGLQIQDLYAFSQYWDGVPKPLDAPQKRRTGYVFLQDIWSLARDWELTAGVRYDRYSDFGGTLNPRLALVWQATDRLTAKLMYGQAFRAPSYLELHLTTSANPPNPGLKPERSKTWEGSLSWLASRDLRLGVNLYDFERTQVIAPEVPSPYRFQNFDRFVTRGIELEAQWQATRALRLSGNLSHMKSEDVTSPLRDASIPMTQAYLRADWAFLPKWNWNLQAKWFDSRPLKPGDARSPLGSFALADTTVRYLHDREWEFAASIRNLFDKDAREYSSTSLWNNLPLPGRNFYGEVRYKF